MTENTSTKELLALIEQRIAGNQVKDAVHKIKFMTARDVIKELLRAKKPYNCHSSLYY